MFKLKNVKTLIYNSASYFKDMHSFTKSDILTSKSSHNAKKQLYNIDIFFFLNGNTILYDLTVI